MDNPKDRRPFLQSPLPPDELMAVQEGLYTLLCRPEGSSPLVDGEAWAQWCQGQSQIPVRWANLAFEPARGRLGLYGRMMDNTVGGLLRRFYPLTHHWVEVLCAQAGVSFEWDPWIHGFRRHCPTTHFSLFEGAAHLDQYLQQWQGGWLVEQAPWLVSLVQYEFEEVRVLNDPAQIPSPDHLTPLPELGNEWEATTAVWNPTLRLYHWPYNLADVVAVTHKLPAPEEVTSQTHLPGLEPQETSLAMYRDPWTHKTRFMVLNPMTAALFSVLSLPSPTAGALPPSEKGLTLQEPMSLMAFFLQVREDEPTVQQMTLERLFHHGRQFLGHCRQLGIVLGCRSMDTDMDGGVHMP